MAENPDKKTSVAMDTTGAFFSVGAPLQAVRPGYIKRPADDLLYQTLFSGNNAHVIAPGRTGKSSLIASTAARLQEDGVNVAVLDLEQIGERDGGQDAGRWYYSVVYRLLRQLRIKIDLQDWWQDKSILSNRQRLVEFYIEVILNNTDGRVVVFVDGVQSIADSPAAEHFLASIRAAHNARITEPEFNRLNFALAGDCDPLSLVSDSAMSPFIVSQEITLGDFSRKDIDVFSTQLNLAPADAKVALDRIYSWTSGHPYLTQKLARSVVREQVSGDIAGHVDRIAMQQLAGRAALHSEPHMSHVHRKVIGDKKNFEAMLNLYGKLCTGMEIRYDRDSKTQRRLRAVGLVVVDGQGCLSIRNKVYEKVFTAGWANQNLPIRWRGPAIAVAIVLAIAALPFWYTQMLPRPYMEIMASETLDLETVSDSYMNLRSFPGHADTADRLYQTALFNRALQADDQQTIERVATYATQLVEGGDFADRLVADYWDRQVGSAMRIEDRDSALMASLESLVVSTPVRRRRAATLLGNDYPALIGSVPVQGTGRVVIEADELLFSHVNGADIKQWMLQNDTLEARAPWSVSALEVTPLVRRVVVDREGEVARIAFTINVGHARLSDLQLKVIAPSGRTADLLFNAASSQANEDVRFDQSQLAPLVGEPLNGTWSLVIRDEVEGVTGHLIDWALSLNSQVVVENFERGLDIPDPVARQSDNVWLSPDGRHAIARAQQSDSARLWDLRDAQAIRTVAVPASERVLGLSARAEYVVTMSPDSVNLWRIASGRRDAVLAIGGGSSGVVLGSGGEHFMVQRQGDADTVFELWSIRERAKVDEITVAGIPSLVSIDADGSHLALADYDRSVRVWNLASGDLLTQFDLQEQPSAIELSANGDSLGVVHGNQGLSLWRTDTNVGPLLQLWGLADWRIAFSPSGARLLAGNSLDGYAVYQAIDGTPLGSPLGSGIRLGNSGLLAFSNDERVVVTGAENGATRFWHAPLTVTAFQQEEPADSAGEQLLWGRTGNTIAAISPGGERLAMGDSLGHIHILSAETGASKLARADEEISFLGHQAAVTSITFSNDGSLVASAGRDGSIRIWDAHSGLPRPYRSNWADTTVDEMVFSATGSSLAARSGQRLWIMNVETGAVLGDLNLGERLTGSVFAGDDLLCRG
jgi:WD40 repeat protein